MATKIIPSLFVTDIKVNIDYLVSTLGFKLNFVTLGGARAILNYNGAILMLHAKTVNGPPPLPENYIELQVWVDDIEDIYLRALTGGAIISRYLESGGHKDGKADRRFTASLPDGYLLTFVG